MKNTLVDSAAYQVNNLPLKEQVVYDAQFICHQNRHSKKALSAIKRLPYSVGKALEHGDVFKEFKLKVQPNNNIIFYEWP